MPATATATAPRRLRWIPLVSSSLASVVYDDTARVLEVAFVGGGRYRYLDVPPGIVDALARADSAGGYFARCVRKVYRCERLD
jgi:hypothetical protein